MNLKRNVKSVLKDQRGVTLVELVIASTLLLILLGLAYMVFAHLMGVYDRTERKWLVERNVQQTMSQVEQAIEMSYQAELSNDSAAALTDLDRCVIYLDNTTEAGKPKVMFRDAAGDDGVAPEAVQLNELPVDFKLCNKKLVDDGAGNWVPDGDARGDLLYLVITAQDEEIKYQLSTAVHLPNIQQSVVVPTESGSGSSTSQTYTVVSFNVAGDGPLDLGMDDIGTTGCFIATAAYGDYDQSGVMLLRRFRDQCLLTNEPGQWMVETYYRLSPPIADQIAQSPLLRAVVRILLLPLVGFATALLHPLFSVGVGAAGVAAVRAAKPLARRLRQRWGARRRH